MNDLAYVLAFLFAAFDSPYSTRREKGTPTMLKAFNAFQIVTLFAAMPHIIGWLYGQPFPFSTGALWVAIATYVILFVGLIVATFTAFEKS